MTSSNSTEIQLAEEVQNLENELILVKDRFIAETLKCARLENEIRNLKQELAQLKSKIHTIQSQATNSSIDSKII